MMIQMRNAILLGLALCLVSSPAYAAFIQRFALYDSTLTNAAVVTNTTPGGSDYGVVTRSVGTTTVDSELAAAAALADNTANPTVPGVGAFLMGFDAAGATWDRVPITTSTGGAGLAVTVQNASTQSVAALDSTGTGIAAVGLVGQFDDTGTSTVTEDRFAHLRVDSGRNLRVNCVAGCSGSNNISQWGGTNVVTGGVNGSVGVGGLAASGATAAGNPVKVGGVFNTTQPTVTTGQAVDAQMTARGAQIVAVGTEGFTVTVNGNTTEGQTDNGLPVGVAGKAYTSISANSEVAGDRVTLAAGVDRVLIMRPHTNLEDRVSGTVGITDGSSTQVVAAQGANLRFCATTIVVGNSSATDVTVDIRDGTAGTVLMTIPAGQAMGGAVVSLPVPLCTTANTIFAADPSAAATTVSVSAVGFKSRL